MLKTRNVYPILNGSIGKLNSFKANFSVGASDRQSVKSVDLAYISYETAATDDTKLPPLIILHGLFGSKSNWSGMSKAIHRNTGRKVISVDARNHGDSPHSSEHSYRHMAEDTVALMNKLSIHKASVLGHSMGGRTAMVLSLLRPDLVSNLIVADISPVKTSPSIFTLLEIFEAMTHISIPDGVPMSQARKIADAQLVPVVPEIAVRNFIITNLVQSDEKTYNWRINVSALKDNFVNNIASFPENLENLKYEGKTLFIGGANSDYIGRDDLPKIRNMFPLANLTYIDGSGHWVHSEKPEAFLKLACNFLISN